MTMAVALEAPRIFAPVAGTIEIASPIAGVRLWLAELDMPLSEPPERWLSPGELERAARFVFARDGRRYRAAHAALRRLLRRYGGLRRAAEFETGVHGKPRLPAPGCGGFNLSHSEGWALIGIGDDDVFGVDIERLRPLDDVWALAEQNFGPREIDELRQTPSADVARAFLSGWTRKEACLKAVGCGLSLAPASFEVGLRPLPGRVVLDVDGVAIELCVESVDAGAEVVAAVATGRCTAAAQIRAS
jgi:4'-phosphopantetheinyl transferase